MSIDASVKLLLHCEGSSTSTVVSDSAAFPMQTICIGTAQLSTAQYKFGSSSLYLNNPSGTTGNYLQLLNSPVLTFGTGDFTIELWAYWLGMPRSYSGLYDSRRNYNNRLYLITLFLDGTTLKLKVNDSDVIVGNSLSTGQWYHIALCRASGTTRLFVDGTQVGSSYADSTDYSNTFAPFIGSIEWWGFTTSYSHYGYLDEIRISNVARYTANFTTPTAAFADSDLSINQLSNRYFRSDLADGGQYRIRGTVTEVGLVGRYPVCLYDRYSSRLVRKTFSSADGSYAFNHIAYRPNGYFAIAFDHGDNPLNAAIADLITPEPMP